MEAVLCSKKRTDNYLWVINKVHVQTLRPVRATGHKTPGESSEIRMRLLEGCFILYTDSAFRVSVIGAKLVCLSLTSKQARVALEYCHAA